MASSNLERAARMHAIAAEFRDFVAQTHWPLFRARMLETAAELDSEAAKLDHDRQFAVAS